MLEARAPLDPELAAIVAGLPPSDGSSIFDLPPDVARGIFDAGVSPPDETAWRAHIAGITDEVAEFEGLSIPIRVYRPKLADDVPTVLFFHGGGFMLGGIAQMDDIARRLCRDLTAVIVSVSYRLAPEHRFPAARDDAIATARWALANVDRLGGDAGRVALVGESSGGNLAVSAALELRGSDPGLAALMLVVPGVDLSPIADRSEYPLLNANDMAAISRNYLGTDFGLANRYPPSPLYADDLSGLPPTVLAIAGHDVLAVSNEAFAARLTEAGVTLTTRRFDSMFHPFFGFAGASQGAAIACAQLSGDLAAILQNRKGSPK